MSLRWRGWRALGGVQGISLMEILITTFISVIVLSAMGSLYMTAKQAFDLGATQVYVQRQGTLLQEQVARWAKSSVAVQVVQCGGNTTGGRSLAIEDVKGTIRCIYQNPEGADTDAGLFTCRVATWTAGCTGGTTYNMLNVTGSEVKVWFGSPLRVRNTTFTRVTCIGVGSCDPGAVALSVASPLVDVRFDLTDNTIMNPQSSSYRGMRFGFSITARN